MKYILCFFALLGLAASTYTPTFSYCKELYDIFLPQKVTVIEDPNSKNNLTVSTCGITTSWTWSIQFDHLEVSGTAGNHIWNTTIPYHYNITTGFNFCLNYTSDFAKYNEDIVNLRVLSYGIAERDHSTYESGCIDIQLRKGVNNFLSMR